eukprot:CAMPEP_0117653252 /NCGR_PEP_ID=MMETSP0804-20121206/3085_1 /TAXON_ID=1074897 /ORGANISM="Tetraselmis astigmatica, Strain CCMP880" /LENGTH=450 /DNA_ID=CAMNT_0005459401 /DNA_START=355 /DNA_END=1707 /DNA_ORIENTATION=-
MTVLIIAFWGCSVYLLRLLPTQEEPIRYIEEPLSSTLSMQKSLEYPRWSHGKAHLRQSHSSRPAPATKPKPSSSLPSRVGTLPADKQPSESSTAAQKSPPVGKERTKGSDRSRGMSRAEQDMHVQRTREALLAGGFSEQDVEYLQYADFPEKADLVVTLGNFARLKKSQPFSRSFPKEKLLPVNWTETSHDTCALVGSSGLLKRNAYGAVIDSHDVVVRMNQAPTEGYETIAGGKTTYRMLNNKWTTVYYEDGVPNSAVGASSTSQFLIKQEPPGVALVVTRAGTGTFEQLAIKQHRRRPDLRTLYLNSHINSWARKMLLAFKNAAQGDSRSSDDVAGNGRRLRKSSGNSGDEASSVSTGFLSLYFMLQICKRVAVYGFTLPDMMGTAEAQAKLSYHYFKKYVDSENLRAHPHHDFKLEGLLLKTLHDKRYIRLCANDIVGAKMGDECGW